MKRLMLVLAAVVVIGAGAAAIAGCGSGGQASAAGSAATGRNTMPMPSSMPMPTTSTSAASKAPATVELHRSVVHLKIVNFAFEPSRLIVSPGTRVVWTNEDSDPHTVTADSAGFSSQALDTGSSYTLVAKRAGSFPYHCTIHPFMHGTLVVQG
jgi:plastocyanin